MEKIFISIAGLCEAELIPTVTDFLENAGDATRLHFSIVAQDTVDRESELKSLMRYYGATMSYQFLTLKEVRGIGYARMLAQKPLTLDYEYYLQIDAHSRASDDWDNVLIRWYNTEGWENDTKFIYSTYPKTYGYISDLGPGIDVASLATDKSIKIYYENNISFDSSNNKVKERNMLKLSKTSSEGYGYDIKRVPFVRDFEKRNHQYFCAGFVFGRTEHILDVPYDPNFFYHGEEITMSIRFLQKGIKIVEPMENLIYHDYFGHVNGRRPSWYAEQGTLFEDEKSQIDFYNLEELSKARVDLFMDGYLDEPYGVTKPVIDKFYSTYCY